MALTSTDFMAAPGLYGTNNDKLDYSDVLAAILLKDTGTLAQIPMKGNVANIEHFWLEDSLNSCILYGTISVGAGSNDCCEVRFVSPATSASIHRALRGGGIVRQEGYPTHVLWASAWGSVTISAAPHGNTTLSGSALISSAQSLSTRWFIVGQPKTDEDTYSDDISKARTRRKNYTQIFERGIQIAETREHIDLYAVNDELKHQIKMRTYEIKRELNNAVLNSYAYAAANTASPDIGRHTMAGIIQLIRMPDLSGTNTDANVQAAAGAALTLTRINDLCKLIYDNGGFDDQSNCCIITSPYQARIIALLEEGRIRKASNELVVGTYANAVKTDLGFDLPVVIDRWCPSEMLIVLDKSRVALLPLQGDAWHLEKMAKTGRSQGYQLSGQYTVELRNGSECHGLIHGLARDTSLYA